MIEPAAAEAGTTLRCVELAERLRTTESELLRALGLVRGIAPDLPWSEPIAISAQESAVLLEACDAVAEQAERVRALAVSMPVAATEIRLETLQAEAEVALADGVAEVERVALLLRCLPVDAGFRALAVALRTTDCRETWGPATIGGLLGQLRGADPKFVRRVADSAGLTPESRWDACEPREIDRLAGVLERHAATFR